jgi:hypothetical protein
MDDIQPLALFLSEHPNPSRIPQLRSDTEIFARSHQSLGFGSFRCWCDAGFVKVAEDVGLATKEKAGKVIRNRKANEETAISHLITQAQTSKN